MTQSVALDFDGVLHLDMGAGGSGNIIPEGPVPGAIERLLELINHPQIDHVYIFSLRCYGQHGIDAMASWLYHCLLDHGCRMEEAVKVVGSLSFVKTKPENCVIIDDRCMQFKGNWNAPEFSADAIANFKGWNR